MRTARRLLFLLPLLSTLLGCAAEPEPQAERPVEKPRPPIQASFSGRDPSLRWDAAGNLHVLAVEERDGTAAVVHRRLGPQPTDPVRVSPPGLSTAAHGEVTPVLEILPDGALVALYPVTLPGKWKAEIRVQRSDDGGATWGEPGLVHPERHGSHTYLSSAVAGGRLVLAWLDNSPGQMGLHTASSADGQTFTSRQTLDPRTCECCGTDLLAGRNGALWLAYRALDEGDVRDIRVLKASGGAGFGEGVKLADDGWAIQGCPHTGARLAEAPDGTLWGTWFTGAEEAPGVYVASSRDGGASFAPREAVALSASVRHPEIGALPDGGIAVLYEEARGGGSLPILLRKRDPGAGTWTEPAVVAAQGIYPRLAVSGDRAALAFTCRAGQETRVVVTDWSSAGKGPMAWTGCDASTKEEHHHH